VNPSIRGRVVLLLLVLCAGALAACGKKGPPLPPLARIPTPPGNPQAVRLGDDVYVSFGVPSANVSGQTPADVAAIDLYAFTGAAPPEGPDPTKQAVQIGTYAVQPVLPPPPPPPEGVAPPPPPPLPPGFVQGATGVVRETLTPDTLLPTPSRTSVEPAGDMPADEASGVVAGPLVAPTGAIPLKRFYYLVARGPRGRVSTPSAAVSVPLHAASAPPTDLRLEYTEASMTLRWTPAADARVAPAPPDPSLLPVKPLLPPPPPTTYQVFEATREAASARDDYSLSVPAGLSPKPLAGTEVTAPGPIQYGVERCFVVRAVDTIGGVVTMGRASEPGCVTPVDTFPPAPPQRLAAIAGVDVINLIWEPNTEPDLAGYLVLRGTAPGGTLQALTPTPIRETTYRDQSVRAGERYVYAVVAVDSATPQNVSGQSNRVEEESRPPR
jgi:predicted small lipoprotein YifL